MCSGMNLNALNWALLLFAANVRQSVGDKVSNHYLHSYFKLIRRASSHYFQKMIQPYLVFDEVIEMDETYIGTTRFSVVDSFPTMRWIYGLFERRTKLTVMYYLKEKSHDRIIEVIKRHCKLGSTLMSDMHSLYVNFQQSQSKLCQHGYYHMWCNHSETMVHYKFRFLHSLNIEQEWLQLKKKFSTISHAQKEESLQDWCNLFFIHRCLLKRVHKVHFILRMLKIFYVDLNNRMRRE